MYGVFFIFRKFKNLIFGGSAVVMIGMLAGCNPEADLLKETTREPNATLRFANFSRSFYRGTGGLKWSVKAEEAFVYQEGDKVSRIIVYHFEMNQADKTDPVFISAERGELNHETGRLVIEGNIMLKDKDGTIQSDRMNYDTEKKIADSKNPVTLNRKGLHTVCRAGIYFDKVKDQLICRSPKGTVESGDSPFADSSKEAKPVKPSQEDIFQ